ncbi:MAG: NAD(P)-binding domain-containing protein, partial [Pseudomonadota bacterium]
MPNVTFIGLGNMGRPMSANLIKAGHAVTGFDLSQAARDALVAAGGRAASSIAEAVAGADAIVTMVPTGKHVRTVYEGPGGILATAPKGAILIDSSTIDVDSARAVGAAA